MFRRKTLEKLIQYRIKRKKDTVFILDDFNDLSDKNQVMRALKKLIDKKMLIKVGQGLYVKSRRSILDSSKIVPINDLNYIAKEGLKKLGVKVVPTKYEMLYNQGLSTQVPTGRVIGIKKGQRVSRKIGYNGFYIKYAKN